MKNKCIFNEVIAISNCMVGTILNSIYFNSNCSLRYILTLLPNSFLLPDCCRRVDRFRCLELCSHVDAGVNVVVDVDHAAGDVLQQEVVLNKEIVQFKSCLDHNFIQLHLKHLLVKLVYEKQFHLDFFCC